MKKTLISLAAAATLAIGLAASAKADPTINFGIQFGNAAPDFAPTYFDPGYSNPGYIHHGYNEQGSYDHGYRHAALDRGGYDDDGEDCGYEWVTGWHVRHHHMVYGPYQVLNCN